MDYGKYKYESQKKANQAKKKQKTIDIKEIKLRPNIDVHDYQVKMRSVQKFLNEGDKVKITLRFRGREMAHQDRGADLLQKVKEEIGELIEAVEQDSNKIHEAADVIYHLMVYLEANNIKIEDVMNELKKRQK